MRNMTIIGVVGLLICPFWTQSQSGPGGVGNTSSNGLWIKADAGTSSNVNGTAISSWNDQSGNGVHVSQSNAVQRPVFTTNVLNGYPAILFDDNSTPGQNDFMSGADSPVLDNTSGLTIFSVIRPTGSGLDARSIISKRDNVNVNHSFMFFLYTSNYMFADIVGSNDRFNTSPTAFTPGSNYLLGLHYDGTLASTVRTKIYSGNTLVKTSSETNASIPDYNSPLIIGATHITDERAFGGYIAEVIHYREALNETRRIIVNNYLSAKYNIALASNDYYTMDNPGNGNFDHEVAGIGRISSTDLHNDAKGSSILRISNPSDLNDNEFLFWGHNGAIQQATNTADVPSGVQARFARTWRVSEVNASGTAVDVGAVDLTWDLTGLGAVNPADLRLLVDTDNDGILSDETAISGATSLGGNVYRFAGVTAITNQARFTLGTANKTATPLPITMLSFTADLIDNRKVELEWKTGSETNNDYFTVERSTDLVSWKTIDTVKGAGNSSSLEVYNATDLSPAHGVNYYRITQTDFNGQFTHSELRTITIEMPEEIILFPNPANDIVIINRGNEAIITIQNAWGQNLAIEQVSTENATQLDISQLPAGTYFVTIVEDETRTSRKLIVN